MITLAGDIGGTRIKLGVIRDGRILAKRVEPANSEKAWADRICALEDSWRMLCAEVQINPATIDGIGIGFPSLVDPKRGVVLDEWGKFPGSANFNFSDWAQATFKKPVSIDNDARTALLGEWRHGAGRGCDNAVMVTLGTGIGVAVLLQGQLLRGAHGQAGSLGGHFTVRYGGRRCVCGNVGCAEAEASTTVLRELATARTDFSDSPLASTSSVDYSNVFRFAAEGDSCASALRDHSLRVWAATVVNIIHAFDPERVIIGGGIMESAQFILPPIQQHVERCAHTAWGKVSVVGSELGDAAALLGCEYLVAERMAS